MTELKLYKFITENNIEWHRHEDDVIIFIHNFDLPLFHKLLPSSIFDDGINIVMKDKYLAIHMKDICEYCDIDMNNVFEGSVAS